MVTESGVVEGRADATNTTGVFVATPVAVTPEQPEPGKRFGRLIVMHEVQPYLWRGQFSRRQWLCACDCGIETIAREDALKSGHTRSCGCFRDDCTRDRTTRHGGRSRRMRASEYDIWRSILRDHPPDGVCERWKPGDGEGYLNFIADLGARPSPRHRLVRLDADGCFSGGNCRWSDSHRRRGVPRRLIVVSGRELTLREASDLYGVDYVRLCKRLERGWSVERALDVTVPPREPSG